MHVGGNVENERLTQQSISESGVTVAITNHIATETTNFLKAVPYIFLLRVEIGSYTLTH